LKPLEEFSIELAFGRSAD